MFLARASAEKFQGREGNAKARPKIQESVTPVPSSDAHGYEGVSIL